MKILAFDTSADFFSIALTKDEKLLAFSKCEERGKHAEMLICAIEKILNEQKIWYENLDLIAVTKGPGSFTGVRIALTAAKILHAATNIPLILPSSLEVLAYGAKDESAKILATIPSNADEFFCQEFLRENHKLIKASDPYLASAQKVEELTEKENFLLRSLSKNDCLDAHSLALIALEKFQLGEKQSDQNPLYLQEVKIGKRK